MQPSSVEPNIRRASRTMISTEIVPATTAEIRHPKLSYPNSHSPSAMHHLPSGGCATKPGPSFFAFSSTP